MHRGERHESTALASAVTGPDPLPGPVTRDDAAGSTVTWSVSTELGDVKYEAVVHVASRDAGNPGHDGEGQSSADIR